MYNVKDIEKAKEYLAASSYNGETLRFRTTTDNDYFYKTAMVVAESAKEAGINIEVMVSDNATLRQYREDPTMFDMFSGGIGPYDDPTLIGFLDSAWPGLYDGERKNEVLAQLLNETDEAKRLEIWAELSQIIYDDLPVVTFGERRNPIVYRNYVHDLFSTTEKIYWNSWISK
jgi:peptide/nickel transport system substrate-binding protein